jgi:hypothetical protein
MGINFKTPLEEFDILLPTFQRMIDFIKIEITETNTITNNINNNRNDYSSNFNELPLEEILENDDNHYYKYQPISIIYFTTIIKLY